MKTYKELMESLNESARVQILNNKEFVQFLDDFYNHKNFDNKLSGFRSNNPFQKLKNKKEVLKAIKDGWEISIIWRSNFFGTIKPLKTNKIEITNTPQGDFFMKEILRK